MNYSTVNLHGDLDWQSFAFDRNRFAETHRAHLESIGVLFLRAELKAEAEEVLN